MKLGISLLLSFRGDVVNGKAFQQFINRYFNNISAGCTEEFPYFATKFQECCKEPEGVVDHPTSDGTICTGDEDEDYIFCPVSPCEDWAAPPGKK